MVGGGLGGASRGVPGKGFGFVVIEEAGVLGPVIIHQHLQLEAECQVEEPAGRDMINADAVGVELADERKIFFDLFRIGEGAAPDIGFKRPIGHAFRIKLLGADTEKFTVRHDALGWRHVRKLNRQFRLRSGHGLRIWHD